MTAAVAISEIEGRAFMAQWAPLAANEAGDPIQFIGNVDRTIQFAGTFGGATVVLEGSLDGTDYHTLTDAQAEPISVTAAALEAVTEAVRFMRPRTIGGNGSTAIRVHVLLRKTIF